MLPTVGGASLLRSRRIDKPLQTRTFQRLQPQHSRSLPQSVLLSRPLLCRRPRCQLSVPYRIVDLGEPTGFRRSAISVPVEKNRKQVGQIDGRCAQCELLPIYLFLYSEGYEWSASWFCRRPTSWRMPSSSVENPLTRWHRPSSCANNPAAKDGSCHWPAN
jgi:hypothetical protein